MNLYELSGGIIKVELDLSNYAAKDDVKNAIGIAASDLASKLI